MGYKLLNATVGEKRITLDDVEYTQAKLAGAIHAAANKATPVGADELGIFDSATGELRNATLTGLLAGFTETDPVFTASEAALFATGDAAKLAGIEAGAQVNNISNANATDLTDGGSTTLHTHAGSSGAGELLMQDGVSSPPVPLETEAGTDWLYQG
jgi:hypothetical protein